MGGVCLGAGCGNGIVDPNSDERCDDGNRISLDGCSADCASAERCGDGVTDYAIGEQCDCGDGSSVLAGCTMANADTSGASCRTDCQPARCGDNVLDPAEVCDDGNTAPGDGCRADCAGRWTQMQSGTFVNLFDVWGTGPNDVWAVGRRTLLHYDGVTWTPTTPPEPNDQNYSAVWGTGPDDVYALGWYRLDHFDGTTWSIVQSLGTGSPPFARRMWADSSTNLWIGYEDGSGGPTGIQHYNGTLGPLVPFDDVDDISGVSGKPLAVVKDADTGGKYRLLTHNGSAWVGVTGTASIDPVEALPARFIHAVSASSVFVLDVANTTGPLMRHFDGVSWSATRCCDEMGTAAFELGGVPGDFILAGFMGRAATSTDGFTWKVSTSGTTSNLTSSWSWAPKHAFIVGDGGTILY